VTTDYSQNNNAVTDAINSSYTKPQGNKSSSGYQFSAGMTYQVPKSWIYEDKQSEAKVCYVIATWSGRRRAGNKAFHKNPIIYLKKHFGQLEKMQHSLDLIVLAIPHNSSEPEEFTDYLSKLPKVINGAPIVFLRRENIGQSYGSYSDAFTAYPSYDYYIFMEDDYAPTVDNFDEILIQMFEASPECGYLCSYGHNKPPEGAHAAISNGISNHSTLTQIMNKLGHLPYGGDITKTREYAAEPQLAFSRGFMESHTRIYDYLSYYKSPFNNAGKLIIYGPEHQPALLSPVQFLQWFNERKRAD
jgi:hypothetical protein